MICLCRSRPWHIVRQKFPDAGLVLIGSGSLEQDLREQEFSAALRGTHSAVRRCPASRPPCRRFLALDLMLRTTLYDGDAVSVREALHVGTPVIASDNGMRPAGVHLIPKSDLHALLHAIERDTGPTLRVHRS